MQLRQAKALGTFNHDGRGIGNVNPYLNHRRRHHNVILVREERHHHFVFLLPPHASVQQHHAPIRKNRRLELLVHLFGRRQIQCLALFNQRTNHKHLAALFDLFPHVTIGFVAISLSHPARADALAVGRQFVQKRGVEVAVDRQGQRARDWRGGHHQHVRVEPFVAEPLPLFDAEAVLFINHHQPQRIETHLFGKEGVGANHQIHLAPRNSLQHAPPLPYP